MNFLNRSFTLIFFIIFILCFPLLLCPSASVQSLSPLHLSSSAPQQFFSPFYFIHHSDPQIGRSPEGERNLDSAVAQIGRMRPAPRFIFVDGDMADNPLDSAIAHDQWTRCRTRFNRISIPKYYVAGNNDIGYPSELQNNPGMIRRYRRFWGIMDYYSVDLDSCHFIVLNSTLLNCFSGHPHDTTALQQDSFLRWDLQNIQSKIYRHKFFVWHFPPYYTSPTEGNQTGNVNRPRRDTLLAKLVEYNFTAVFTGHTHGDRQNLYGPSLLQTGLATCTGPLTSTGYRIVKVFKNGIETWTVYLSSPLDTMPLVNIVTATAMPETVMVNQPVSFRAVTDTVNYPSWRGLTYRWLFGDGDSARIQNTSHVYTDTGHYKVVFSGTKPPSIGALYHLNIVVQPQQHVAEEKTVLPGGLSIVIPTIQKSSISFSVTGTVPEEGLPLLNSDKAFVVSVYNISGRLVTKPISISVPGTHRIKLGAGLPAGIYFVHLSTPTSNILKKIILLR